MEIRRWRSCWMISRHSFAPATVATSSGRLPSLPSMLKSAPRLTNELLAKIYSLISVSIGSLGMLGEYKGQRENIESLKGLDF